MVTGDKCQGMVGALEELFPQARYQRRTVHFYRNVLGKVLRQKRALVAKMLKAIHAQEPLEASVAKAEEIAAKLDEMRLKKAAKVVREGHLETLTYAKFPLPHWTRIRTNNAIERHNRETRHRTRMVGTFPDGHSALMLVTARLKYIAEREWGKRRYLDVSLLEEVKAKPATARSCADGNMGIRLNLRKILDGTFGLASSEWIQSLTGLSKNQVARGMAELKEAEICPIVRRAKSGAGHFDRSCYDHVAQYQFTKQVWNRIEQNQDGIDSSGRGAR